MRRLALLLLFLGPAVAADEKAAGGKIELKLPPPNFQLCSETLCAPKHSPWEKRELLGEAMGRWLGVKDGRWDAFNGKLFEDFENGPVISGTVRHSAAQIQLRWRPGG